MVIDIIETRLRQAKKNAQLKRTARETGLHLSTLSRIAAGERGPSAAVIERLAKHWRLKLR